MNLYEYDNNSSMLVYHLWPEAALFISKPVYVLASVSQGFHSIIDHQILNHNLYLLLSCSTGYVMSQTLNPAHKERRVKIMDAQAHDKYL